MRKKIQYGALVAVAFRCLPPTLAALASAAAQASGMAGSASFNGIVEAVRQTVIAAQVPGAITVLGSWIAEASRTNPQLQMPAKSPAGARAEATKHGALGASSLGLIARGGRDRLHGGGDFGTAENDTRNKRIGVQLTIPLFIAGDRSARQEEALHPADKARTGGEHLRKPVTRHVRAAGLGISAGAGRIAARQQAPKASRPRLDAMHRGRSVGDRPLLGLLNAQHDAANAALARLPARTVLALDRLRLSALAGRRGETALQPIDAMLQQ